MALIDKNFHLQSAAPLIMHNSQLSDPDNYFAAAIKQISSKRLKTPEDRKEIGRLEYLGGLYLRENGDDHEVIIPADVIEATLVNAAKKLRLGPSCKAGLWIGNDSKLEYEGPQTPEELWLDNSFVSRKSVRVGTARVMRTRPMFRQ